MGLFREDKPLSEERKKLMQEEADLFKRERIQSAKEGVFSETRSLRDEEIGTRIDIARVESEANVKKSEIKNSVELARSEAEGEKKVIAKDLELAKKENEIENEKDKATLSKLNEELSDKVTLKEAELNSKQAELKYTQAHIDALLSAKDGIIKGYEIGNQMLKDQLEYMQRVLAVAVGKIPTVDFSTVRFNIEQPAAAKGGQGGGNQQGQGNKPANQQ